MSLDAYKIAVKISLVDGVTRGLQLMSRHFKAVDSDVAALESRLKSIGKLVAVGGGLFAAGAGGLSLFKAPIAEAMEFQRQLAALHQMGLGDGQIADAQKFATANQIIGTSMRERMEIFTDAQGSFRESGMSGGAALNAAKMMLPVLAQYKVATSLLSGPGHDAADGAFRNLNKTIEIMGGVNDPRRAQAIAEGVFKAAQSSGRMVDERQLKQFVSFGSSATNQLTMRAVFGGLEPLIGEFGGSTAGTGLRTAYNRVNGMMALMPKRTKVELQRLGMADATGREQPADLARLQATDVIAYAQQIMGRYASHGISSQVDRERENAILYGTNGAKIMNKIMSQMPVLLRSEQAYDRALGPKGVMTDPRNKAALATMDLEKREADLKLHIGQVALPLYVRGLTLLDKTLTKLDNFATAHPIITKLAVYGVAFVSVIAIVAGGIAIFTAGLIALPAMAIAIGASVAATFVGIGLAAAGLYKSWDTIKGWLSGAWAAISRGFIGFVNMLISAANHLPFVNISQIPTGSPVAGGVVRPGNGKTFRFDHTTVLDGKVIARNTSYHQAKEMAGPNRGTSTFDPSRAYVPPSLMAR